VATRKNLELTFYPYSTHLMEDVLKPICSEHGGIVKSLLVSVFKYFDEMDIRSVSAQMPAYHKVLLGTDVDLQYHLGGYGVFYEEALIRLAGEAIERYSLLVARYALADRIRYATYDQIAREGRVLPLEYLRPFSEASCEKLNRGDFRGIRRLERDDVVGWLSCPSLFEPDREIWVPAQMLFVGYRLNRVCNEVAFCPGFSTGTAAHTSFEKALQSALLEFIEIDALMVHWYCGLKAPTVTIDDLGVAGLVPKLLATGSRFEVVALDLKAIDGVDAHVIGAVLVNRRDDCPLIVFGAQGHLDPARALYRGLMEAMAISFLGVYGPLYQPKQYLATTSDRTFTDLDRNVAFFTSPESAAEKRRVIENLKGSRKVLSSMKSHDTGDVRADTARLIRQLGAASEYGVYLDITPAETAARGWKVMRVYLPELVTMCVPGVPYDEHPRLKAHGGIRNGYPHPLP
jgi:thiazole/oxazole-forming peptide maturase SagD family component